MKVREEPIGILSVRLFGNTLTARGYDRDIPDKYHHFIMDGASISVMEAVWEELRGISGNNS